MKVLVLSLCVLATGAGVTATVLYVHGAPRTASAAAVPQHLTMEVLTDDDQMLGSNLVVAPGRIVLRIVNRAGHSHVFSVPELGVEHLVLPGSRSAPTTTTVSFTVPRTGAFMWFCRLPCGKHMSGSIYARWGGSSPHGPLWSSATA